LTSPPAENARPAPVTISAWSERAAEVNLRSPVKPTVSLRRVDAERAVPWRNPQLFAWHRARYQFALPSARDARVLDVGSGEGYGAAMLAEVAREVVGVDYSPAAIDHAQRTYRPGNLRFELADANRLDLPPRSFDLVTAFEVIEHLTDQSAFLAAIASAIGPEGRVIISTPNTLLPRRLSPYHIEELTPRELRRRLRPHFDRVTLLGQSYGGSRVFTLLEALDVLNLGRQLARSARVKRAIAGWVVRRGGAPAPSREASEAQPGSEIPVVTRFRFSPWRIRRARYLVAIAESPCYP
jgi:2-polyprenyl-3-methyl-5-hydroxy-6-metoxy-1,4-benzoquinol methylase